MNANWPLLKDLNLSCNNLTASAMSYLTQLSWTKIAILDLTYNPKLDSKAIEKLAAGSWPCLRSLAIHGSFGLKYFVQVAASSWPLLETVDVQCAYCPPRAVSFAGFAPNARELSIVTFCPPVKQGTFGMPAVSGLTQPHWPNLQTLDLRCSHLGSAGIMQLSVGRWPLLSKLDLTQVQQHSTLPPWVYARLAQGNWPQLTYLSLAGHRMDDDCAAELVNADWPKLQTLDLVQNHITTDGCARLAQGNWPDLKNICLHAPIGTMQFSLSFRLNKSIGSSALRR